MEDLFRRARSEFGRLKEISPPDCKNCRWNFLCHNGCPWFRWARNERIHDKSYLCPAYRKFFSYTMERFEELRDSIRKRIVVARDGVMTKSHFRHETTEFEADARKAAKSIRNSKESAEIIVPGHDNLLVDF